MHKFIVANYKMNGNLKFYKSVAKNLNSIKVKDTEIILCPPFVYLSCLKIKNKNVFVGCQDIAEIKNGKSTGQISPEMLQDFSVKYTIVGHSERRAIYETDSIVANKTKLAIEHGIVPIVCVGEDKKSSAISSVLEQVEAVLYACNNASKIIFAYEPVWAIGSGEIPTNEKINRVVNKIKKTISNHGIEPICLYGGSVNDQNFENILKTNIDGFLLGGVSKDIEKFKMIVKGVSND